MLQLEGLGAPLRAWYELLMHENEAVREYVLAHDARRILEIGCGPGRFIRLLEVLGMERFEEIHGVECDPSIFSHLQTAFGRDYPRIKLTRQFVTAEEGLSFADGHFDLCINAMNIVGWQSEPVAWLEEMVRCSETVFFTVYKTGRESLRMRMYESRGHVLSNAGTHLTPEGQILLGDCDTLNHALTRAFTPDQVHDVCQAVSARTGCTFEIDGRTDHLVYLCWLKAPAS